MTKKYKAVRAPANLTRSQALELIATQAFAITTLRDLNKDQVGRHNAMVEVARDAELRARRYAENAAAADRLILTLRDEIEALKTKLRKKDSSKKRGQT